MRISKYSPMLGLALGVLVIAGAGCMGDTTTNTNTGTTVNNSDAVVTDELILDNEEADVAEDTDVEEDTDVVADEATIEIVEPADGDIVASTFDLVVEIEDFTLAPDKVEGENAAGEGHYHVWVDGEYYAPGVAGTTAVADLEPGEHELMVSLQNNDHTDLTDAVQSEPVTVTVEAE